MSNPHEPKIETEPGHAAEAEHGEVQQSVDAAPIDEHPEAQAGG